MGARLTCSVCSPLNDSSLLTVHAEVFTLSSKRNKWIKVHNELLEVTLSSTSPSIPSLLSPSSFQLQALSPDGRMILDTRVLSGETSRLSDSFIQTIDIGGRILGINVVSSTEATALLHTLTCESTPQSTSSHVSLSARGQSTLARIRIVCEWRDDKIVSRRESPQTTVVLITPVFLVFHYERSLVHINLLESIYEISGHNLRLSSSNRTWELTVADSHRLLSHILNQSSQILAKTSSRLAAAVALRAKIRQLRNTQLHSKEPRVENALRVGILEQRISCLEGRLIPLMIPHIKDSTPSSLFLYLVNGRNMSLWESSRTFNRGCTCEEKEEPIQLSVNALMTDHESIQSQPDIARLRNALCEIMKTEREYVKALQRMISLFLPIHSVHSYLGCSLRLVKEQQNLLSSLERAYLEVEKDLEREDSDIILNASISMCRVFISSCSHLKVYAEYAAAYMRFQRNLHPQLIQELKTVNCHGEHSSSYESHMIKPIQRVAQYPLLLDNVLSAAQGSTKAAEEAQLAVSKMRALVQYVNEMQRIEEHLSPKLTNIKSAHAQLLLSKGLRMEMGDLLMLMTVSWEKTTCEVDSYLFVYSALILLLPSSTHSTTESVLLPLDEVSVQDASSHSLLIIHVPLFSSSPLVYHIKLPSPAKSHLLKHIRKARLLPRKSRPMSGSSKSDGGYASDHSPPST